jgi:hypothetical protein
LPFAWNYPTSPHHPHLSLSCQTLAREHLSFYFFFMAEPWCSTTTQRPRPPWPETYPSTPPWTPLSPFPKPTSAAQAPTTKTLANRDEAPEFLPLDLPFPARPPLPADVLPRTPYRPHPAYVTAAPPLLRQPSKVHCAMPPPAPARCPASAYKRTSPLTPLHSHPSFPPPRAFPEHA